MYISGHDVAISSDAFPVALLHSCPSAINNHNNFSISFFFSQILRFRAKMISNVADNDLRHFVIKVFTEDDTISIFELAPENTGQYLNVSAFRLFFTFIRFNVKFASCQKSDSNPIFLGIGFERHLFQSRMKVMLPGQDIYTSVKPKYYEPPDFYIGARVNLCGFQFQITAADDYGLTYMEKHCDKVAKFFIIAFLVFFLPAPMLTHFFPIKSFQFPMANVKLIMNKVRQHLRPVYREFVAEFSPKCEDGGVLEYRRLRFEYKFRKKNHCLEKLRISRNTFYCYFSFFF